MFVCIVYVSIHNIHLAQSQATLLRVYVFAKQYSIVLALVQVLCSHTDQVISHTRTQTTKHARDEKMLPYGNASTLGCAPTGADAFGAFRGLVSPSYVGLFEAWTKPRGSSKLRTLLALLKQIHQFVELSGCLPSGLMGTCSGCKQIRHVLFKKSDAGSR
jgi:hypothetical protein